MNPNPSHVKPVKNLILMDTTVEEEITDGGIIVSVPVAKLQQTAKTGKVVALGPDVDTPGVVVGATVIVVNYQSDHFFHDGRRYHFAPADKVMAIIAK